MLLAPGIASVSVVVANLCVVEGVRSRVAEGRGPAASTGRLVLAREAPLRGAHGGRSCGASAPHATCRAEQLVQSSLFRAASPHASSQTSFPVFHPLFPRPCPPPGNVPFPVHAGDRPLQSFAFRSVRAALSCWRLKCACVRFWLDRPSLSTSANQA